MPQVSKPEHKQEKPGAQALPVFRLRLHLAGWKDEAPAVALLEVRAIHRHFVRLPVYVERALIMPAKPTAERMQAVLRKIAESNYVPMQRPKPKHPKCEVCGRFMKRQTVGDGWRCPKLFFDDYAGGWDHN